MREIVFDHNAIKPPHKANDKEKPKEDDKPAINDKEKPEKEEFDTAFFDPLSITSPNDVKVLKALGLRRQELDLREKSLGQKELELTILGKKVEEKVKNSDDIIEYMKSYSVSTENMKSFKENSKT
jgi:hypothetical protein